MENQIPAFPANHRPPSTYCTTMKPMIIRLLAGRVWVAHAAFRERVEEEIVVDGGALGVVLREIVDKHREQQEHR